MAAMDGDGSPSGPAAVQLFDVNTDGVEAVMRDITAVEHSVAVAAFRFLAFFTERSKTSPRSRQLLLVSGALHAALLAAALYPASTDLRRLGLEVRLGRYRSHGASRARYRAPHPAAGARRAPCLTCCVSCVSCASVHAQLLRLFRQRELKDLVAHISSHAGRAAAVDEAGTRCVFCSGAEDVDVPPWMQDPGCVQVGNDAALLDS
jgi:hypothetical protein